MSFVQKHPKNGKKNWAVTFFALNSLFHRNQNHWKALAKNKAQQQGIKLPIIHRHKYMILLILELLTITLLSDPILRVATIARRRQ
jgi:uncharacterized protein YqiB (DUF1249 family)